MAKIPIYFIAVSQAHALMDQETEIATPNLAHIGLEISPNLKHEEYYEGSSKVFNSKGATAFTNAAVEGLIANIKVMHQKGWWNNQRHLEYIIERLQQALTDDAPVQTELKNIEGNINLNNTRKKS